METLKEIQDLMLKEANEIVGFEDTFAPADITVAYSEASKECQFTFPEEGDEEANKKILWLSRRMRRFILMKCWIKNVNAMKAGDLEAQQLPLNYKALVAYMDKEFTNAKETEACLSESIIIPLSVYGTGIVEDRIGQSIESRT